MEIKSTTFYSEKNMKEFSDFAIFGRTASGAGRIARLVISFLLPVFYLVFSLSYPLEGEYDILPSAFVAFMILLACVFVNLIFPSSTLKAHGHMIGLTYEYTFGDDRLFLRYFGNSLEGTMSLKYRSLYRVLETRAFFGLYTGPRHFYIVDKSGMKDSDSAGIRNVLAAHLPKGKNKLFRG